MGRKRPVRNASGAEATQLLLGDLLPPGGNSAGFDSASNEENEDYLGSQILTYLGNKRALLKFIGEGVEHVKGALGKGKITFFDAFSGSGIVSRFMKKHASLIVANDLERYSEVVNRCYLANKSSVDWEDFDCVFREYARVAGSERVPGTVCRLYAPRDDSDIQPGERVFYTRNNALILDSARAAIDKVVPERYFDLILAPLLADASIHANTSGVFKGFYKNRKGIGAFGGEGGNALVRICGDIVLQRPVLSNFDCDGVVLRGDATAAARTIDTVDLAYFDPPYNQHPYGSNYFMLNLLVEGKEPDRISKVSGIPEGWNHSPYNRRKDAEPAFFELLSSTPARFLMVSYNSEGFIKRDRFMSFLSSLGDTTPIEIEYNTFRGCRNLNNRPLKVTEYLFLVKRK